MPRKGVSNARTAVMKGNMRGFAAAAADDDGGEEDERPVAGWGSVCAAVEGRSVAFDAAPELGPVVELVCEEEKEEEDGGVEGMGRSDVMASRVSAATIPPMLCPMRIVWTDGSSVGDGVPASTSRSITWFWSQSRKRATHSRRSPRVSYLG